MKMRPIGFCTLVLLLATIQSARAIRPDECEQQRAQFPKQWNDVSREKVLFICREHSDTLRVMIGETDGRGRTLMSLAPSSGEVRRMWLDREQLRRLEAGRYFATVARVEKSCWIRGSLSGEDGEDTVFFMDNADPPADDPKAAGSFYNKAPRFSVYLGRAWSCERVK